VLRNHKGCLFILLMALGLLGWVSGPAAAAIRIITHLCGVRTETCPPGMKTGDPISPPGGYVGGDMQMLTDIAIDPAGNVWVASNWQDGDKCFGKPPEAKSTLCGGNGLPARLEGGVNLRMF
jgi:hypothetical protein